MNLKKIAQIGMLIASPFIAFMSNADEAQLDAAVTNSYHAETYDESETNSHGHKERLNVVNGRGDGTYRKGDTVRIRAENKNGRKFSRWSVKRGSPKIKNMKNKDTMLKMPSHPVTIEAIYKSYNGGDHNDHSDHHNNCDSWEEYCDDDDYNDLQVINGNGDGNYESGKKIRIRATRINGKRFVRWSVTRGSPRIQDKRARDTMLKMPNHPVRIQAVYKETYGGGHDNDCDGWDDECDNGGGWDDGGWDNGGYGDWIVIGG